jgi:hypothetical protein
MIGTIPIAASSSSSTAVFTLLGAAIGAVIAAGFTLWTAKYARASAEKVAELARVSAQNVAELTRLSAEKVAEETRKAAETAWIRNSRREIYERFLTCAQSLQIACEAVQHRTGEPGHDAWRWRSRPEIKGAGASVDAAHTAFFEAYGMVLAIAEDALVKAARTYAYQLWELKSMLDSPPTSVIEHPTPQDFEAVDKAIRHARHDTIAAIRPELGARGSARPKETDGKYNPFCGFDSELAQKYAAGKRDRPGSAI